MAITHQEVKELFQDLRSHYALTHRQMLEEDRAFEQQFDGIVDVPYEVRIFKSATARNIVEGLRNQIRTNEPTVIFKPEGPSSAALKHSILMQKWGYAMLRKERYFSNIDPTRQNGFDLILRGASCKKIVVDVDQMMEEPPRRGTKAYEAWEDKAIRTWPFRSKAIDPMSIFVPPGQRKPFSEVIEQQVRYAGEIQDMYPTWVNPDKKGARARPVEWLEYYSEEQYWRLADGVPAMDDIENPYGLVPYLFEWSGAGRNHMDNNPVHLAVGILTGILGEVEEEVRLKTAISVQTQMHVFPPILTVEDPKKVARQFGVGPGKVIKHPPGHPPVYMEYPAPNENMYRFLEVIHGNISRVYSASLSGQPDAGVRFGVLNAQNIGQALTTISAIRATLDDMGSQTLNMMVAMARKLDLNMAIEGGIEPVESVARVSGKDFTHQNFVVTFEAVDPSENDRALLVGEAMRRQGDISQRTFWEKYAKHVVEDADEEEIRLITERTIQILVESGAMGTALLSEDVQNQLREEGEQTGAVAAAQAGTQQRTADTTTVAGAEQAQELEALAGTPGAANIPREVAEAGLDNANPTRTGVPRS